MRGKFICLYLDLHLCFHGYIQVYSCNTHLNNDFRSWLRIQIVRAEKHVLLHLHTPGVETISVPEVRAERVTRMESISARMQHVNVRFWLLMLQQIHRVNQSGQELNIFTEWDKPPNVNADYRGLNNDLRR